MAKCGAAAHGAGPSLLDSATSRGRRPGVAVCFAGLSYSTFAYSDLKVTPGAISATITNNGSVAGSEAAQLYLGYPAEAGEPPKVLRGISKVSLQAGAKATVRAHRLYLCTVYAQSMH
jgi:hypothetical protein